MNEQNTNNFFKMQNLGNSDSSTISQSKSSICNEWCITDINTSLNKIIELLSNITLILQPTSIKTYFNTGEIAVTTSTPTKPDPNEIAGITGYDRIRIFETLGRIAKSVSIINDGNANLYVITSPDGLTWSSDENPILLGESRKFYYVYEIRIRSPVAGNVTTLQGGVYRVTEYDYSLAYVNTPLYNKTSLTIQSLQNVSLPAVGQQLPSINISNGFALVIRATQGNVGSVYVATSAANLNIATTRATLLAGDSLTLHITNANLIWVAGSIINQNVDLIVEQ